MSFNLDDYEPVDERLAKFWADHHDGVILTDLQQFSDTAYIVRAEIYRTMDDTRPAATGWAQESVTAKGVNSTSALENCETSAIGRALANLGYAAKGKRPSREEMAKTETPDPRLPYFADIKQAREAKGWTSSDVQTDFANWAGGAKNKKLGDATADELQAYAKTLREVPL